MSSLAEIHLVFAQRAQAEVERALQDRAGTQADDDKLKALLRAVRWARAAKFNLLAAAQLVVSSRRTRA